MNILSKKLFSLIISLSLIIGTIDFSFATGLAQKNNFNGIINDDILSYSKVTDFYIGQDNSIIVWIQDLHNDFSTQKKIYNLLSNLTKNKNFDIYSEGVIDTNLDTSILQYIPNEKLKEQTINNLFEESVLSACEYFALSNTAKQINGIEDRQLYYNNLELLEKINSTKKFNNFITDNIIKFTEELKHQSILNRVLALQILKLNEMVVPENFPNLKKYQTVSNSLSNINSKKLNSQFKIFVEKTKGNPDIYNLLKLNSDYGYSKIYDYINSNLPEFHKNNNDELLSYFKANKQLFEINQINLVYEKELFINQLLSNESLSENETEILDLNKFAKLLKDLINTNILPGHYMDLKENKKYVLELFNKYLPKDLLAFATCLLNNDDIFEFYNTNINRNEVFVKNLTKDFSNKIIVAGGFHCDITKDLKKLNWSYIVLTPTISFHAFNKLFSTTLKYGSNNQKIENILTILDSWKLFFKDVNEFQKTLNDWISQNPELKDSLSIEIDNENNITISYNETSITKNFKENLQSKKIQYLSKNQQTLLIDDMLKVAKQHYLFGQDVDIKISSDNTLLDLMLPMTVKIINDKPTIFVHQKFLSILHNNHHLIQIVVKLLYFYSSKSINTEHFISFINQNYFDLQQIYEITTQLKETKASLWFTIKSNIKNTITNLRLSFNNFSRIHAIPDVPQEKLITQDEKNMAEALKQATLARQTRNFLTTFTQPPIGAYLVNADGIKGKNFNNTKSVLHTETLTFMDFLKNYIHEYEKLPSGEITEKGIFLLELLDLAEINGQNISNKIFQNRPMILKNLGIGIDYSSNRDIDMVFVETNAVLKFVNQQLANPLASATLYCTLAPCNKCSKTMIALGIDKLVYGSYSANRSHKSINTILNAGIEVVDGVLLEQCNKRIVNYRFINLSVFGTKIASSIQTVRRLFSNFNRKIDKNFNYLIAHISLSETKILDLKYGILDLQLKLNWTNLQSNSKLLDKLTDILKQTDAYDNIVKRASMIYAIKTKCSLKIENGNIIFYNKEGKKLDFYINVAGKLVVSKNYSDKINNLATLINFADVDDNLAIRKSPFNKEMQAIFSILTLYGIGQPILITGNTLEATQKRLDPLGRAIENLIPAIYIENATMQVEVKNGVFVKNQNYMDNIAKSTISEDVLKDLNNIFGNIQQEWYDLLVSFINKTKNLRKQPNITYQDLINILIPPTEPLLNVAKHWKDLSREQAATEINKIYQSAIDKKISRQDFLNLMKQLSLIELARLYFSKDPQDQKEAVRLRQDIKSIEQGDNLYETFESPVRYVVIIRPSLVREKVTDYFKDIIQQKYPDLEVISTGQTTLSVYKKGINKATPIKNLIQNGALEQNIIFTGDEFNVGGVDYPVYLLQQQGNKDLIVINTNGNSFEGDFISLSKIEGFSSDIGVDDNIKRSVLLQKLLLSIVEENIGLAATDSEYEPINIAQELKSQIYNQNIADFETENQQSKIANISDILKAG